MSAPLILEYRTQGGPMFVGSRAAAAAWTGSDDDGSGVVVEYMSDPFDRLPQEYQLTRKAGMQRKKFATLQEARAFQKKLYPVLIKLHPKLDERPTFPSSGDSYIGELDGDRVFSLECLYTSMYGAVLNKLGNGATVVPVDKKKKACAVFFEQNEGGPGIIAADPAASALVIAKPHTGGAGKDAGLGKAVAALIDPKARARAKAKATGKITVDGPLVIFPAGLSQRLIAEATWRQPSLNDVAGTVFDREGGGPLRIPDQKNPGGAFVRFASREYTAYYHYDVDVGGGAAVMWLAR